MSGEKRKRLLARNYCNGGEENTATLFFSVEFIVGKIRMEFSVSPIRSENFLILKVIFNFDY